MVTNWNCCTGRYEEDFISQRMQQLRQWIERMCLHPVVSQSEVFKHFMSVTEEKVGLSFAAHWGGGGCDAVTMAQESQLIVSVSSHFESWAV